MRYISSYLGYVWVCISMGVLGMLGYVWLFMGMYRYVGVFVEKWRYIDL